MGMSRFNTALAFRLVTVRGGGGGCKVWCGHATGVYQCERGRRTFPVGDAHTLDVRT